MNKIDSKSGKAVFNLPSKSLPRESKRFWKMQGANLKRCIFYSNKLNRVLPLSKNLKMEYQFPIKLERLIKKANTCNFSNIIITA